MPKRKQSELEASNNNTTMSDATTPTPPFTSDAAAALAAARSELATLSRVSHRLAMVDTSAKLTQVLDKLLPRLLQRIGTFSGNTNTTNQSDNSSAALADVRRQSHSQLVQVLSHTSQRVRDDTACRLPCLAIVQLLVPHIETPTTAVAVDPAAVVAAKKNDADGTDTTTTTITTPPTTTIITQLPPPPPFTLNLALAFLTTGVPRVTNPLECEALLPWLMQLCRLARYRCRAMAMAEEEASATAAQKQYAQATHLLLTCVTNSVAADVVGTSRPRARNTSSTGSSPAPPLSAVRQSTPKATPTEQNNADTVVSTTTPEPPTKAELSPLKRARHLCRTDPAVAASTYSILLDALLYQPNANPASRVPPAGLSQDGHERMLHHHSGERGVAALASLQTAVLEFVSPVRRWCIFGGSSREGTATRGFVGGDDKDNDDNVQDALQAARTTVLLLVAAGTTATAERATMYLKQTRDTTVRSEDRRSTVEEDRNVNTETASRAPLTTELLTLCLGDAHAGAAFEKCRGSARMRLEAPEQTSMETDTARTSRAMLSTKRRPVDEAIQVALIAHVSKLWMEDAHVWDSLTAFVVQILGTFAVRVASRNLASSTTGLSRLRAKPYLAAAELLLALATRLAVYYDSQYTAAAAAAVDQESTVELMAQCLSTACSVLTSVSTVSIGTDSRSTTSNDGSIAMRDTCYGVVATLARSQFSRVHQGYLFCRGTLNSTVSLSTDTSCISISIETAAMLFGCAANEQERLRPRAVAALDALLAAYCRAYAPSESNADTPMDTETTTASSPGARNPWLTEEPTAEDKPKVVSVDRSGLARSLLPLVWTAAQTYQPKASRVAASRWTSDLLKELDDLSAFHLLCFLAGDSDVTAATIARDGLGLPKHLSNDDDILAMKSRDYSGSPLPDFGEFAELLFPDSQPASKATGRVQWFRDFSLQGKAATLRFGLYCLLNDLYGGEDKAVGLYLGGIVETLRDYIGTMDTSKDFVDLLDECSACLLTTLSASKFCRTEIENGCCEDGVRTFGIQDLGNLSFKANSSRARRYFAGSCGKLFEDADLWQPTHTTDGKEWVSTSGLGDLLSHCAKELDGIEKKSSVLSGLHGSAYLGAHIVRALRLRGHTLEFETGIWDEMGAVVEALGEGMLHADDFVGNACADSVAIALSYDSPDAPILDSRLYYCTASVLEKSKKALKKYIQDDTVNPARASKATRATGLTLAATTTGSGVISVSGVEKASLGPARHECIESLIEILGSAASRKEEEIAIIVGEALADYADAYSPDNVVWNSHSSEWPVGAFSDETSKQLPPHEQVLYILLRKVMLSSSPHKKTACAPALLAIVGRGAFRMNSVHSCSSRSLVKSLLNHLTEVQDAFLSMLTFPKSKQFSRESCCLGLASCRGLLKDGSTAEETGTTEPDELNERLLRAFGQTTNFGRSLLMETDAQASERRAAEGATASTTIETEATTGEIGGASGIGEAALGAYREMAAASVSLGRHDIMYALLFLSVSHSYWFTADARDRYSVTSLMGESSFVGTKSSSSEFLKALRPHLGKLLPRILRACHDPNKQTRQQMNALWINLTGGGEEGRRAITQHFLTTFDNLVLEASSKLWRARAGSCVALAEIIVGRQWNEFGGGGPVLTDDDFCNGEEVVSGIRLLRLWRVAMRALDDVQGSVRESGERLARAVKSLSVRLCNPSKEKKKGRVSHEASKQFDKDATAAAATTLRWLLRHGLNQKCSEATGSCISSLVEVVGVVRPTILEPSLPALIGSLLLAISGLEPAALNYLQLRTTDQAGLERLRLQLAQSGPIAIALTKCIELVPHVGIRTQQQIAAELDSALRLSAGFATRAATADAVSTLCSTCPTVFRFSGSSTLNPSVRLLRAIYFTSERERGAGAKDKMIHALGNLASLCPASSVRTLAVRACDRYRSSTGNNFDAVSRRASAATLKTIAVRASDHFSDGGNNDIWCSLVLPTAYLGRKDSDPKIASLWNEVWEEGGSAANLRAITSKESFGTRLEERLLTALVSECVSSLRDVSWDTRVAGASALIDLCDINILAPVGRSDASSSVSRDEESLSRALTRAKASTLALRECVNVLMKPRLWTGKAVVLKAVAKLVSKWVAAEFPEVASLQRNESTFSWRPVAAATGDSCSDLFVGDEWFLKAEVEQLRADDGLQAEINVAEDSTEQKEIDFDEFDSIHKSENHVVSKGDDEQLLAVNLTGLCRFLVDQAEPLTKLSTFQSDELLPYKTAAFRCLKDILNSLPTSIEKKRIEIYGAISNKLLHVMRRSRDNTELDKKGPPVLVAGAVDCLSASFWDNVGSVTDTIDCSELMNLLKQLGGKLQPAWTVREASCHCIAKLAHLCQQTFILKHIVVTNMVDCAKQALGDRKFWRVRVSGLAILRNLINRAGPGHTISPSSQLVLEALLPHKELIVQVLRSSLTDSEAKVTALSSDILTALTWWP